MSQEIKKPTIEDLKTILIAEGFNTDIEQEIALFLLSQTSIINANSVSWNYKFESLLNIEGSDFEKTFTSLNQKLFEKTGKNLIKLSSDGKKKVIPSYYFNDILRPFNQRLQDYESDLYTQIKSGEIFLGDNETSSSLGKNKNDKKPTLTANPEDRTSSIDDLAANASANIGIKGKRTTPTFWKRGLPTLLGLGAIAAIGAYSFLSTPQDKGYIKGEYNPTGYHADLGTGYHQMPEVKPPISEVSKSKLPQAGIDEKEGFKKRDQEIKDSIEKTKKIVEKEKVKEETEKKGDSTSTKKTEEVSQAGIDGKEQFLTEDEVKKRKDLEIIKSDLQSLNTDNAPTTSDEVPGIIPKPSNKEVKEKPPVKSKKDLALEKRLKSFKSFEDMISSKSLTILGKDGISKYTVKIKDGIVNFYDSKNNLSCAAKYTDIKDLDEEDIIEYTKNFGERSGKLCSKLREVVNDIDFETYDGEPIIVEIPKTLKDKLRTYLVQDEICTKGDKEKQDALNKLVEESRKEGETWFEQELNRDLTLLPNCTQTGIPYTIGGIIYHLTPSNTTINVNGENISLGKAIELNLGGNTNKETLGELKAILNSYKLAKKDLSKETGFFDNAKIKIDESAFFNFLTEEFTITGENKPYSYEQGRKALSVTQPDRVRNLDSLLR